MKNVFKISVKSICMLLLCAHVNLHAQETAQLNLSTQNLEQKVDFQQTYTVKGKVLDETSLGLEGVNIYLKGTKKGTATDVNGNFEFPGSLEVDDILVFSYIGYNPKEYKVISSSTEIIDITIAFEASDFTLMGAVEVEGAYSSKRNIFKKIGDLFR